VDNSNFLAVQTYHRHQTPGKEYAVYDYFRDIDGKPAYPQRPILLGPVFTRGAAGVLPTGRFNGKMILLESLWDREAFPWQADWYRSKVRAHLGDKLDDNFRLWYTDRALHGDVSIEDDPTRTVGYLGVLQQALLDLSAWVEKGVAPAATTRYKIDKGQVIVPETAGERKGIQPVVTLKVDGNKRAEVNAGQSVTFTAEVDVPENMGTVVAAAWNFEGLQQEIGKTSGWDFEKSGAFPVSASFTPVDKKGSRVTLKTTYTFSKPGTYFPTLRVASQRHGNAKTPYTRIQNLDRVRVVVK
jgi:plastocyanin